jgi:hypothetical protein
MAAERRSLPRRSTDDVKPADLVCFGITNLKKIVLLQCRSHNAGTGQRFDSNWAQPVTKRGDFVARDKKA